MKLYSKPIKLSWITTHYYIIAMYASFIYFFWEGMRAGVVSAAFMSIILLEYIFKIKKINTNKITLIIIIYIYYNLFAMLLTLMRGYPVSLSVTVFSNSILPIVFYFVAVKMSDLEEHKFVKSFMYACLFLILVGIYLYVTYPDIYHQYMMRAIYNYSQYQGYYRLNPRLNSFTNSIIVGSIGCMGFAFSMVSLISTKKNFKLKALVSVILMIGIMLTMQRSAWAFMLIIFVIIAFTGFKSRKGLFRFILIVGIVAIVFSYIAYAHSNLMNQLVSRLYTIIGAIDERNSDWSYLLQRGIGVFLVGDGLGTRGHQAMQLSSLTIRDGYYIKLLFEVGVIGSVIFSSIMVYTIRIGFLRYKKCLPYICIVIGVLFQAIGSNILDFQLVAPMFWFSIGRINQIENQIKGRKN